MTDTSVTITVTIGKARVGIHQRAGGRALKRTVELADAGEAVAGRSRADAGARRRRPSADQRLRAAHGDARSRDAERRGESGYRVGVSRQAVPGTIFTAGYLEANARATAVATRHGLFAYHRSTDADLSMTARTPDGTGSGWATGGARDWGQVDPASIGRIAAQKAVASRNPQAIEPGLYTAVLEPSAVTDLVPLLGGALNARSADEGRSPFSKPGGGTRVGEKVMDERVTLYSDPSDPQLLGQPFDTEGLPLGRTVWVENGILRNLAYSRFWAQKQGRAADRPGVCGRLGTLGRHEDDRGGHRRL